MEIAALLGLAGLGWSYFTRKGQPRCLEETQVPGENQDDALRTVRYAERSKPDADPYNPGNWPGPPLAYGAPRSQLEAAFYDRTAGDGPADVRNWRQPEGLQPWFGRSPLTPLTIDPQAPYEFLPPRREISQDCLRGPPMQQNNVFGAPSIVDEELRRARDESKAHSARGSMDYVQLGNCSGFSTGLEQTKVIQNGYHSARQRWFREPPSTKPQLTFRFGGGGPSVVCEGSAGRSGIGLVRQPNRFCAAEAYREPMAVGGASPQRPSGRPDPVLRRTNRMDTGGNDYVGIEGSGMTDRPAMRINVGGGGSADHRYDQARPKNKFNAEYTNQWGTPTSVGEAWGPVDSNPVSARMTIRGQQGSWDASRPSAPDGGAGGWDAMVPCNNPALESHGRVNDNSARYTLRQEYIDYCDVRPPAPTTYNADSRPILPGSEVRRVTPDIQQDIDPSLYAALMSNPYAAPIMV